jgi:para-nitrobenzyl esterase
VSLPTVRIETGWVSGLLDEEAAVCAYLGIPFAKPPVGSLRWRPPEPAEPWIGVKTCDRFGPACLQPLIPADSLMSQFSFDDPPECGLSEDCLYLNVWAPAGHERKRLPVIVFVHGGGHRVGSGSAPVSRGASLASNGAVVVIANYRVGALGYLAHPALTAESGASGHYACLDLLASLTWTRHNIAAFGGDPECVTLFGHSAGGALINVLMASPLSVGLFHRAIVHSAGRFQGGPMGPPAKTLAEAERAGATMARKLGAASADELRSLDPLAIDAPRGFWGPIVDGSVLREPVHEVFDRGDQLPIPLMVGYNRDEASPYPTPELFSPGAFIDHANARFQEDAEHFLSLYPHSDVVAATHSAYALRRDSGLAYQAWKLARMHAAHRSPTYLFNFVRAVPLPSDRVFHEVEPPGGYGAYHGAELWYVFGTLKSQPWPWQALDHSLATLMGSAWLAFARSGDPDVAALPHWPDFGAGGEAMVFDEVVHVAPPFNLRQLEFFETQFERVKD